MLGGYLTRMLQGVNVSNLFLVYLCVCRRCEAPPNLYVFTPYRDDNKDGLKFYTDPNYFYDLWVQSQQQLLEKKKKKVSHSLKPRLL